MKQSKKIFVAAIGVAFAVTAGNGAWAQQGRAILLSEAIYLSLKNSGQLKIANAKVDEARATWHEAKNNRLPDVKASGSYLRLNQPTVDLKIKTGSGTGGGEQGSVKVDQAAYGMLNATLPLFSGFRIKYGIESAGYLEQAARLDADNDKEEVIQNVVNAYSNLYKASKTVEIIKENLQREDQRIKDFGNMERNGLMARNDLLKAQLQRSNIELSLLEAQNNLDITMMNMDLMLGLPENTVLVPDSSFYTTGDAGTALQWQQDALQQRKDVAALANREKAAAIAIKAVKGEYYPGVAVTGGLIAANIPNLLTLSNAANIGIGLQYNLGSIWKTGAKVEGAQARLRQLQATEGIMADRVRLEVSSAYHNYLLSLKKIDVYAQAIDQANENYRIVKNKHDNSLATTTELLEADVAQLQSVLNYTFSRADAAVAYKILQQKAGTLTAQQSNSTK